jgi:hypothetical protein
MARRTRALARWAAAALPAALAPLVALVGGACGFDPPPRVALDLPPGGVWRVGEPLRLTFSEPVRPASLAVRVWPQVRDVEGALPPDATPLLATCRVPASPCGAARLELAAEGDRATLWLDPAGLGRAADPLLLEVLPGLVDPAGRRTRTARWFDFQFLPPDGGPPAPDAGGAGDGGGAAADGGDAGGGAPPPVPFEDGIYVLVGTLSQPVPAVMTYITHMVALDDGRVAFAGAEGDEVPGALKETTDPRELFVDETTEGYTVHGWGRLQVAEGERFLSSEPFAIEIVTNGIVVALEAVRIHARITRAAAVDRSVHDRLEGTFAFEGATVTIGDRPFRYEGGTTGLVGVWAPPGTCEAGAPDLCGDPCGAVVLGRCTPPAGFPGEGFCDP